MNKTKIFLKIFLFFPSLLEKTRRKKNEIFCSRGKKLILCRIYTKIFNWFHCFRDLQVLQGHVCLLYTWWMLILTTCPRPTPASTGWIYLHMKHMRRCQTSWLRLSRKLVDLLLNKSKQAILLQFLFNLNVVIKTKKYFNNKQNKINIYKMYKKKLFSFTLKEKRKIMDFTYTKWLEIFRCHWGIIMKTGSVVVVE